MTTLPANILNNINDKNYFIETGSYVGYGIE